MARLTGLLSMFATGGVVLYVFFTTVAGLSPLEVAAATIVIVVLAALLAVRYLRIGFELRDPGGDPSLRDARNRDRERRGF